MVLLSNLTKLTHDKFNNKIFLLKMSYKNWCVNFDVFSRQNGSFIFLKMRRLEAKELIYFL